MYIWIVLTIMVIAILLFTGQVKYEYNTEQIKLYATYWIPYTIKIQDIDSIKMIDQINFGIRLCGLGSTKCAAGLFRNKVYGNYILYTDNYLGQHLEIKLKSGKIIVLGIRNESMLEVYNNVQSKIHKR